MKYTAALFLAFCSAVSAEEALTPPKLEPFRDPIPACIKSVAQYPQALIFYCKGWSLVAPLDMKPQPNAAMATDPAALRVIAANVAHSANPNLLRAEAESLAK